MTSAHQSFVEADRMSREALFRVQGDTMEVALGSFSDADYRACLDPQAAGAVAEIEQMIGSAVAFRHADVGRGAGVDGVAIEVAAAIAAVGGASATLYKTAQLVRKAYHKLARRTGTRPMISLGAAEYLALADLNNRVDATQRVIRSGDVNPNSTDRAFTGGDMFYVVCATESGLDVYHVSAYGELFYVGSSPPGPNHWDPPPVYEAGDEAHDDD